MVLSKEQMDRVVHAHLKKLVEDLDNALWKQGTPISREEHLKLHYRARRYIDKDIVVSVENVDYSLHLNIDGTLVVSVENNETGE
jgi:hypothetical protein